MPVQPRIETTMGLFTFGLNVTLASCINHQDGIADGETHAFFNRLRDESGGLLWGSGFAI